MYSIIYGMLCNCSVCKALFTTIWKNCENIVKRAYTNEFIRKK